MNSPLSWVGGKRLLRGRVVSMLPPHEVYVEVFGGAGWVLFGKPAESSKSEVLNDLDGELINFWRVLKHRPAEFTEAVSWILASREFWTLIARSVSPTGAGVRNRVAHPDRESGDCAAQGSGREVARAVRFYALIKLGFGSHRVPSSFGSKCYRRPYLLWPRLRKESREIVKRLRRVWIENLPWEACLKKFDGAGTMFYLDPPYRRGGSKAYLHKFSDDDHRALAAALRRLKGEWLLSYNDDPWIEALYAGHPGVHIDRVEISYAVSRSIAGRTRRQELLIRNYELPASCHGKLVEGV